DRVVHFDQLGLAGLVAFAVGKLPGNRVIAFTERPSLIGHTGDYASIAVVGRGRCRRQTRAALPGDDRQSGLDWGRGDGVVHLDLLGLAGLVAFAVGKAPGNRVIAFTERPGLIGRTGNHASIAVVVRGRCRRQSGAALSGDDRQSGLDWGRCERVVHFDQ